MMRRIFVLLLVILALFLAIPESTDAITYNNYKHYNKFNSPLITESVRIVEPAEDGGMWFGDYGGGALYMSPEGDWTLYRQANSGLLNNYVTSLTQATDGTMYFGSVIGVSVLSTDGKWKTYDEWSSELPDPHITSIAADQKGGIWHGVLYRGVSYRSKDEEWDHYNAYTSPLPSNNVRAIVPDDGGGIWFGTSYRIHQSGGAAYLDKEGEWKHYNQNNSGIPSDYIVDILPAQDGSVWFATRSTGIARLHDGKWTVYDSRNSNLRVDSIRELAEDTQGNIWAATWGSGLVKIDNKGNVFTYMKHNSMIPNNYVLSLAFDKGGDLWVGTNLGITRIKGVIRDPGEISIYIDGDRLFTDVAPVIVEGRTLVPMRHFFEKMYQNVEWAEEEKKIIVSGRRNIVMHVGEKTAVVDGKQEALEVAPKIINGRTMVPLRWVGESLNAAVGWNPQGRVITVKSKK